MHYFNKIFLNFSGNEFKKEFWKMVFLSTNVLPKDKPRYLMGVGFALEMIVCCALGIDMYDCVFPTRTAVSVIIRVETSRKIYP